ncbi:MAG: hypothetical protein V1807_01680 [Patescibacteria group bacterium]
MSRQPEKKKSRKTSESEESKLDEITVDLGDDTIFHLTSEELAEWTEDFADLNQEHRDLIKAGRVSVAEMNTAMDF